jgi:hypothetical protein
MTGTIAHLIAGASLAIASTASAQSPSSLMELEAAGPQGSLKGTFIAPAPGKPTVLILPGSGPTDRDGNNPLGVKAATYRLLAEGLAGSGIGSLRADKRGMFGSGAAIADANAVTVADYAADAATWIGLLRERTGAECIWLIGHSEGGLIALETARVTPQGVCGIALVAAPGRPLGTVLRDQLRANPANAPILGQAETAIDRLEQGERVAIESLHPGLAPLFAPAVQGYLIDLFGYDPASMAGASELPMLLLYGAKDLQTGTSEYDALRAARPEATAMLLPSVNHVLKAVEEDTPAANLATYGDPDLPLAAGVIDALVAFVDSRQPKP